MASKQGVKRSKAPWSPPTINVSVPPSAPAFDPVMGASRKCASFAVNTAPDLDTLRGRNGAAVHGYAIGPQAFDQTVLAER